MSTISITQDEMRRLALAVPGPYRLAASRKIAALHASQRSLALRQSHALQRCRDMIAARVSPDEFAILLPTLLP